MQLVVTGRCVGEQAGAVGAPSKPYVTTAPVFKNKPGGAGRLQLRQQDWLADRARHKWSRRCGGAVQALGALGDLGWRATRETQRVEQSAERLKRNRLWCAVATRPFDRNAEA